MQEQELQPTIKILAKINQNSFQNKEEIFTRLYRYLLRPDIYHIAYKNLYANNGAATKGVNNDTADGFSESKIDKIIKSLADGSYQPKPSRRTYIAKTNGKKRPLGIPTFTDKLVQEVLRMILEAVYEPVFSYYSHGFRPKRSCHTALSELKKNFHGAKWFIEGDIKGCFDNINHSVLIKTINTKIKDAKLTQLIWKFLKAGYLENWQYNKTHSGTPQGGIISPILANIYLNELDKFVEKLKAEFDKPAKYKLNPEYDKEANKLEYLRIRIKRESCPEKRLILLQELKARRALLLKMPSKDTSDKSIRYIRYADDFIIGVHGDKAECEQIKAELKGFIGGFLKMELSEEKTLITHSSEHARFLGYDICVRRNQEIRPDRNGITKRSLNNSVDLSIPLKDKIEKFLFNTKSVVIKNGTLMPRGRKKLVNLTELEIVTTYNAEFRGLCNYYSLASNYYKLCYFEYLMEYSCLKTIAAKHKSSIKKTINKYKNPKGQWAIPYDTKKGKRVMTFAKHQDIKKNNSKCHDNFSKIPLYCLAPTQLEERLKAKVCELCGDTTASCYEMHHVNKVKNLKGKSHWERIMLSKRRKTLVVCLECHLKIHGKKEKKID